MEASRLRIVAVAAAAAALVSGISNVSRADPDTRKEKKDVPKVEPFEQDGVIVAVHSFYEATEAARKKQQDFKPAGPGMADFALLTAEGAFAFLETPQNQKLLAEIKPPQAVRVKGKVLPSGKLLHLDSLDKLDKTPEGIDLAKLGKAEPKPVALDGTNKCQCGLKVGELPHSCKLGHLHHLETADGTIYSYLQFGPGRRLFMGKGAHFKKTRVKGQLLPGHFVLVEQAEVDGKK